MSAEKITITGEKNISSLTTPLVEEKELPGRVDINDLLARVREEKKKENKVNLVFFGDSIFIILHFLDQIDFFH